MGSGQKKRAASQSKRNAKRGGYAWLAPVQQAVRFVVVRYLWVSLIMVGSYATYAHAVDKQRLLSSELNAKIMQLRQEKVRFMNLRDELQLRLASSDDRDSIELLLKKKLGLVPKGQVKVVFTPLPPESEAAE